MANTRVSRILALALTLALLAVALSATAALAAEELDVSPDDGEIGDEFELEGYDFNVASDYDIYFSDESAAVGEEIDEDVINYEYLGEITTDGLGEFWGEYFDVPDKLTDGDEVKKVRGDTHYIYATNANDETIQARTTFRVEVTAEITLDPDDGVVGTPVEVTGSGFDANEDIVVEYGGHDIDIESGDSDTDSDGEFSFTINIPESTAGDHTVKVIGDDSDLEADATFTVEPQIAISSDSGAAGDDVTVSGTGFGDEVDITITFDDDEVVTDETTNSKGSFEATFAALPRNEGSYAIKAEDEDDNSDEATFTVAVATTSLSSTTGSVGDEITVTGAGFKASNSISALFDNELVSSVTTDDYGKFTTSFNIPARAAGTYVVKVSDGTNTAQVNFSITTSASISPVTTTASPGYVGIELTVSGVGFVPAGTVTITYDGNQIKTATVNANGTFSASFKVSAGSGGEHTVIATDDINTKQLTFVMESNPPSTPPPLKPEMDIKAKAQAYFDWEDVTDPSGVTYTLQIATDESFTENSMVLEKVGIILSEYTLSKEEKLESVSKEAPYYWRVKAVDGASNESQWTGTGAFYVGFSLGLHQGIIYTLFGVGTFLIGIFGFWLGRKTAYY
ncbi:IPT/TIG domain-containing protein [Chloroflexota bacterium]